MIDIIIAALAMFIAVVIGVYLGLLLHELTHYLVGVAYGLSALILIPLSPFNHPWTWFAGDTTPRRYAVMAAGPLSLLLLVTGPIVVYLMQNGDPTSQLHGFILAVGAAQSFSVIDLKVMFHSLTNPEAEEQFDPDSGLMRFKPELPKGSWIKIDPLRTWDYSTRADGNS